VCGMHRARMPGAVPGQQEPQSSRKAGEQGGAEQAVLRVSEPRSLMHFGIQRGVEVG
jgi:hypothetical protein